MLAGESLQTTFRNTKPVTKTPQRDRQKPRGRPRLYRTNATRQAAYRRRQRTPVYHRSVTVEWETPSAFFATLDAEFHFTIAVAASATNAKCARFYTRAQDGLQQPWEGVCWCNPPFGREIPRFMEKAAQSARDGATVVCLVPARTDTRWWHQWVLPYGEIRFVAGRLKFSDARHNATFPCAVVIYRSPGARRQHDAQRSRGLGHPSTLGRKDYE